MTSTWRPSASSASTRCLLYCHTDFVKTRDLASGELGVGESRQGFAAPECEGTRENFLCACIVTARTCAPARGHEAIESIRVHLPGFCLQQIPAGDGDQRLTVVVAAREGTAKA